jgi:GNAT superfamily N-acetyltransferase
MKFQIGVWRMSEVITYYLEMKSPLSLKEKIDSKGLHVHECEIKQYEFNRFLYQLVGKAWKWKDKLPWTEEHWKTVTEDENFRTWVAWHKGSPAGYYELQRQNDGDVRIVSFGLAPKFIGKGFGGYLLSHAIKSAWAWQGARRVWVHTCTLDHPGALRNYIARGMVVYRESYDVAAGGDDGKAGTR